MREVVLSAFFARFVITVAAMVAGFIFSNGFQLDRIGQLVFFSIYFSLFFMAVWVVMYFVANIALRFCTKDNHAAHNEPIVGVVCELLCFHSYIVFPFLIHFSALYFDFSLGQNFSLAGVGGRMIIEGGELTLYCISRAVDLLVSSYITAALIHVAGTAFFVLRMHKLKVADRL